MKWKRHPEWQNVERKIDERSARERKAKREQLTVNEQTNLPPNPSPRSPSSKALREEPPTHTCS